MSQTAETVAPAVGFDPRAFAEAHGLRSVGLYWNREIGGYYIYAHGDDADDLVHEDGKTIEETAANTVKAIAEGRSNADQKRLARIARLKNELAKLEAPALAEAQS